MSKRRIKGRKVRNFELDASLLTTRQRMGWRSRSQKSAAPARRPLDCRVIRLATIRSDHAGTRQDSLR